VRRISEVAPLLPNQKEKQNMKKLTPIIIVVMTAALLLSACGGGAAPAPSGGAKPAPTEAPKQPVSKPTEKPAAQPTPPPADTPANGTNNNTDAINLTDVTSGLESLDSYQTTFTMSFEGKDDSGQPKTGTMSFTEEFVKSPPAKRTTINGFGAMLGSVAGVTNTTGSDQSVMQTIEVGGKEYFQMGTMCTQSTSQNGPQANPTFNPSDVMGGLHGAQLIGTETINGVPAAHYKSDVKGLDALGYLNAQGEFWIAQPGDYVVKYTFEATGKDRFLGNSNTEGTIKWDYEVKQINQPIDIQAPKDCSGAAEDIPLMADAAEQSAFGGTSMYTTPSAFKDVVAFYEKEMVAKGWQAKADGGMSAEGVSMQSYTKDGRTVQVMITTDASGKTSVMITEEKQ
jgi:hypothetical protein